MAWNTGSPPQLPGRNSVEGAIPPGLHSRLHASPVSWLGGRQKRNTGALGAPAGVQPGDGGNLDRDDPGKGRRRSETWPALSLKAHQLSGDRHALVPFPMPGAWVPAIENYFSPCSFKRIHT
nr:uncharacterized protein LOC129482822 [Symphalangus syndactylus]